jgi:formylglycine-generating enzyme required for sulfatase activity
MKKTLLALALVAGLTSFAGNAKAQTTSQTFGSGANTFTLDFQTIGNAGNAADTTGYGAVNYNYSIGTYDISVNQLNAAASNGVLGLGNGHWSGDQPAANVSWYQAAAFVNFLDTNSGYQAAYNLTYSGGSYTMALWQSGQAGYDPSNPYRNSLALFVLPSENEWYKAAYYDHNANSGAGGYNLYPTGNSTPTAVAAGTAINTAVFIGNGVSPSQTASVYQAGGLSPYGTMGQGGNVFQWEESAYSGANTDPAGARTIRGGRWDDASAYIQSSYRLDFAPSQPLPDIGFRVAELGAVPEPSTYALFGIGAIGMLMVLRRKKAA